MLIKIIPQGKGGYKLCPTNPSEAVKIHNHLRRYGVLSDGCIFLDNSQLVDAMDILHISIDELTEELHCGFSLVKEVDKWEYYHGIVGYCED